MKTPPEPVRFHVAMQSAPNQIGIRRGARHRQNAFTLIELVAVVTILIVLALLFLAILPSVREATNRTVCVRNLNTLARSALAYTEETGHFPLAYSGFYPYGSSWYLGPGGTQPGSAGHVLLLPYIVGGGGSLVQEGLMSDPNLFVCPTTKATYPATNWSAGFDSKSFAYGCPASSYGYYGGFYGPSWAGWQGIYYGSPTGTSGKIGPLFFDMLCFVNGQPPVAGRDGVPYSLHSNGVNIAYSDSHVEWHAFPDGNFWRKEDSFGFSFYLPTP